MRAGVSAVLNSPFHVPFFISFLKNLRIEIWTRVRTVFCEKKTSSVVTYRVHTIDKWNYVKHPYVLSILLCYGAIRQNSSLSAVLQEHRRGVLHPDDCGGGIRGANEDLPGPPRQPPGPRGSQERLQTDGDQDRAAWERGDYFKCLHPFLNLLGSVADSWHFGVNPDPGPDPALFPHWPSRRHQKLILKKSRFF